MEIPKVDIASATDRDRALQTIALGFLADPVCRWTWPDATTHLAAMPMFAAAFGGKAFEHGSAYIANEGRAAALWLPPGIDPDGDRIEALFAATSPPDVLDDVGSVFAQMDACHPKDRPCWHLALIAADPAYMNRGLGAALLKHALRRCDEDGSIAYLETTNPRNISLYERHGFEVVGKIQAGASPTLYPMIREARDARLKG